MSARWSIASPFARAEILADGGILWRPRFGLDDGRWVSPLAEAPWSDDPAVAADTALPPYLRTLGGAFLGLPFGGRAVPDGMPGWTATPAAPPHHGICAVATWTIAARYADRAILRLELPEPDPLTCVEQDIRCAPDRAAIAVTVSVTARRTVDLPVGYHPVLRLPDRAHDLAIAASFGAGHVFPYRLNPTGRAAPGVAFDDLATVAGEDGAALDFGRLPHGDPIEELLLLTGMAAPVSAYFHDEGYRLMLDWDRVALPNCLVWLHDRALDNHPWSGRFRGVGIEPGASAFDFADSGGDNPLACGGIATAVRFAAGETRYLRFELAVDLHMEVP